MNRIKAVYRGWAIPCSGATVYAPRHRAQWLSKLLEPGVRRRAERLYQQLDLLQSVRQQARHDLLQSPSVARNVGTLYYFLCLERPSCPCP